MGSPGCASLQNRLLGGLPWRIVQLLDHMAVGVVSQAGAVAELVGDVLRRTALVQQQRGEAVAKVVRAAAFDASGRQGSPEGSSTPGLVRGLGPQLAIAAGKDPAPGRPVVRSASCTRASRSRVARAAARRGSGVSCLGRPRRAKLHARPGSFAHECLPTARLGLRRDAGRSRRGH